MGNIEIRDQSNIKRRAQIFTERKFYDAARSQHRKSLTQRYDRSHYSPIRFSKISDQSKQIPLTQRKVNTNRQQHYKYSLYSPILNQQSVQNSRSPKSRQQLLKSIKIKNTQIQQNCEQQNVMSSSQKTGRIVSNSNRRLQEELRSYQKFNLMMNKQRPIDSPFQTKEIIKKVRNFNDFLNEIKRKLKQDKQQTLLRNKSRLDEFNKNHPSQEKLDLPHRTKISSINQTKQEIPTAHKTMQKSRSMRRIQIALKLQNQKLQLQKYRKLVERQLSKTHSIQNISICTRNSGQKILTIQYESLLNQNMFAPDNSKISLIKQPSANTPINKILENDMMEDKSRQSFQKYNKEVSQTKLIKPSKQQAVLLKRLKMQYDKMLKNVLELGKTIQKYQQNGIMAESQVDDKILIQEGSEFSKKGSQFSRKESQFQRKQSQLSKKSTQLKATQLKKTQSQCSDNLQSQRSNKGEGQCTNKIGSQRTIKVETQRTINKESQCSQKADSLDHEKNQFKKNESQMKNQFSQFDRENDNFQNEGKGSQLIKAQSQSSRKQSQMNRQSSQQESQVSQQGSQASKQGNGNGKQMNKQQSQGSNFRKEFSQELINYQPKTNKAQSKGQLQQQNFLRGKDSKQKIQKIQSLFDRLDDLQQQYQETDREIREAIGDSYSDSPIEDFSSIN